MSAVVRVLDDADADYKNREGVWLEMAMVACAYSAARNSSLTRGSSPGEDPVTMACG